GLGASRRPGARSAPGLDGPSYLSVPVRVRLSPVPVTVILMAPFLSFELLRVTFVDGALRVARLVISAFFDLPRKSLIVAATFLLVLKVRTMPFLVTTAATRPLGSAKLTLSLVSVVVPGFPAGGVPPGGMTGGMTGWTTGGGAGTVSVPTPV